MYPLAVMFPGIKRLRIPLSRDQVMLLLAAVNEILLGVETYIAHLISGTIVPYEWIPIIFGPISGVLLLLAGLLALRRRSLATLLATFVFMCSIAVGLLGAYFHLMRAIRPFAVPGERVTVPLLVWAPPILGPLTFALVGLLGISAAWIESPPDSGRLILPAGRRLTLPYSKTRAFFFLTGLGALATVISSVLDHARTDFSNPWLWVPTAIGVFATVVSVGLGATNHPLRADFFTYTFAMLLMILVGMTGTVLHISQNLTAEGVIVGERFIRGAPFLAPLLFSDIGTLGLVALLDPREPGADQLADSGIFTTQNGG
jgi:MprA protease rhombosortase-interaction domain-containing protein